MSVEKFKETIAAGYPPQGAYITLGGKPKRYKHLLKTFPKQGCLPCLWTSRETSVVLRP